MPDSCEMSNVNQHRIATYESPVQPSINGHPKLCKPVRSRALSLSLPHLPVHAVSARASVIKQPSSAQIAHRTFGCRDRERERERERERKREKGFLREETDREDRAENSRD